MKTKNIFRFAVVCTLSIFVLACASKKEETVKTNDDELTFGEFDDLSTDEGVTIDEMADDQIVTDELENIETDMPELPGDEQAEGIDEMDELDEVIVETPKVIPAKPVTYQKPIAYQKSVKPYSHAKGYPDYPTYGTSAGGTYIVKRGDSLWAISKRNGISVRELAAANGMSIKVPIKIGQKLVIPGKGKSVAPSVKSPAKTSVAASGKTYTVQSGDSFYKIGKKVGVNYLKLMKYNNATEKTILQPGQVIKLP